MAYKRGDLVRVKADVTGWGGHIGRVARSSGAVGYVAVRMTGDMRVERDLPLFARHNLERINGLDRFWELAK